MFTQKIQRHDNASLISAVNERRRRAGCIGDHAIEADGHDHRTVELPVKQRTAEHDDGPLADSLHQLRRRQGGDVGRRSAEQVAHGEPAESDQEGVSAPKRTMAQMPANTP